MEQESHNKNAGIQFFKNVAQPALAKQLFHFTPSTDLAEGGIAVENGNVNRLAGEEAVAQQAQHFRLVGVQAAGLHPGLEVALDALLVGREAIAPQGGADEVEQRADILPVGLAQRLFVEPEFGRIQTGGQAL